MVKRAWLCFAVGLGLVVAPAFAGTNSFTVIVHPDNPDTITVADVVRIFKADRQRWSDGARILLVLPEVGSEEYDYLLKRIYGMDGHALKKYWIGLLYQNRIARLPRLGDLVGSGSNCFEKAVCNHDSTVLCGNARGEGASPKRGSMIGLFRHESRLDRR